MNKKISSKSNTTVSTQEEETPIITLIPCDCDSFEEDDNEYSSESSVDSSELVEDSDGETEIITFFHRLNKNVNKTVGKNEEIIAV